MRRYGATLIELLLVLGILLILMAVLLPAVQQVRAAAQRLKCRDQMRQLALACHHYESALGRLPPSAAKLLQPTARNPYVQPIFWRVYVGPYVEEEALFREAQEDSARAIDLMDANPPHRGLGRPRKLFQCPADPRLSETKDIYVELIYRNNKQVRVNVAVSSYLACSGTNYKKRDGAMTPGQSPALVQFIDGTSQTFLLGERPPPNSFEQGWLYGGSGYNPQGGLDACLGVAELNSHNPYVKLQGRSDYKLYKCPPGPYGFEVPGEDRVCIPFQFWSLHAGGANFAMADGSVRWVPYTIDPATFRALGTRAGGEVIAGNE